MVTLFGILTTGSYFELLKYLADILPIFLMALIALILSIMSYRNTRKILKKLDEKKSEG